MQFWCSHTPQLLGVPLKFSKCICFSYYVKILSTIPGPKISGPAIANMIGFSLPADEKYCLKSGG